MMRQGDRDNFIFDKEVKLQNYIIQQLKEYRLRDKRLYFWKAADIRTSGISDLVLCVSGTFVAVELKVKQNQPTALQRQFLSDIQAAGGVSGVVRTWGEFKALLNPVLQEKGMTLL